MTPGLRQSVYGIMFNATSVTMICGAALLESMGFRPSWEQT